MTHTRIAAIVPAYNESDHIKHVLQVLSVTNIIDEIIVIDDASSDDTSLMASQFANVRVLRNSVNKGKAQSMQRGVDETDAEILFFCDADLQGFSPDIATAIITPVANGSHSMFIGIRNNVMQKIVPLFAMNSGERALTRELWDKLPDHFKYRYRIEAGLNYIAKKDPKGFGLKKFDYYQTLKEKKYGFLKGTALRWWMNIDVGYAYILTMLPMRRK